MLSMQLYYYLTYILIIKRKVHCGNNYNIILQILNITMNNILHAKCSAVANN